LVGYIDYTNLTQVSEGNLLEYEVADFNILSTPEPVSWYLCLAGLGIIALLWGVTRRRESARANRSIVLKLRCACGTLGSGDHLQDFCTLAREARGGGLLDMGLIRRNVPPYVATMLALSVVAFWGRHVCGYLLGLASRTSIDHSS
jgi:hypothetical protein